MKQIEHLLSTELIDLQYPQYCFFSFSDTLFFSSANALNDCVHKIFNSDIQYKLIQYITAKNLPFLCRISFLFYFAFTFSALLSLLVSEASGGSRGEDEGDASPPTSI